MFYIRFFILKNERFAHPLFLMSDVSELLRLLTKNERITQVAHQKWVNERIARFFEQIPRSRIFSQNTSDSLRKATSDFPALSIY